MLDTYSDLLQILGTTVTQIYSVLSQMLGTVGKLSQMLSTIATQFYSDLS